MAELLNRIPTNLTEYPNSFKRQGAFPLEAYSVFYTMADAEAYASTNAISYVGQTIAVVSANAEDASVVDSVTLYIIADAAGTLQEVGKATNGDGNSIVLDENGVLSIAGFAAADAATLPQKQSDGTIKWVPIDAIVKGDGNTKTVVAAGDEEARVNIELVRDAESDTNTYKISLDLDAYATTDAVTEAIEDVVEGFTSAIATALQDAKDYADANDADTIYDDTALIERLDAIELTLGDDTEGLIKDVADNAQAIIDMDAAYKAADTTTLNSAKAYTDEEITGLTVAIEKKDDIEYIVVKNKSGEEISSTNASKFVQDSFLDDVAYDAETGKITFAWTMGDGSTKSDEIDIAHLVDTYTAGTGLKVENNEFSVDTSVIATVSALNDVEAKTQQGIDDAAAAQKTVDDYIAAHKDDYDNTTVDAAISTAIDGLAKVSDVVTNDVFEQYKLDNDAAIETAKAAAVSIIEAKDYAVASDVAETYVTKEANTEALAKKIETATISHAVIGVEADPENGIEAVEAKPEGVTIEGTALRIVVDAPTRAETLQLIADKVADVTGGESAADVKLALEAEATRSLAKDNAHDSALAVLQGEATVAGSVKEAKAAADAAQETANEAKENLAELTTQVTANTDNIAALTTRVATNEQAILEHATAIGNTNDEISALKTADENILAAIDGLGTRLDTAETAISGILTDFATDKQAVAEQINGLSTDKADKTAVEAIERTIGTVEEGKTLVDLIEAAKTEATYDDNEIRAAIAENTSSIAAIFAPAQGTEGTEGYIPASGVLAEEITRAKAAEKANADAIALLTNGVDPEVIDSVNDLIAYVVEHGSQTTDILNRLEGIGGENQPETVIAAITNAVEAIPSYELPVATTETLGGVKSSDTDEVNKVSVEEDGTMTVNSISTDNLVQGTATLVLNGGNSTVTD